MRLIPIANDDLFYQKVWHKDRNLTGEPMITLGMVDEDLFELQKVLRGETIPPLDLQRLGAVLTVLGAVLQKHY